MAFDSQHPRYADLFDDWQLMRDTYGGQRRVKEAEEKYLPMTAGMKADGIQPNQPGRLAYDAYKKRASFPDIVRSAVEAMVGVMHHKPPTIELPAKLEPMLERATLDGESLEMLLRRINEEQLTTGRLGLLLDVEDGAEVGALPYIAMYKAETVLNWDDGRREEILLQNLNMVVLDESEYERTADFKWEFQKKYRILILGDLQTNESKTAGVVYQVAEFRDSMTNFNAEELMVPSLGGRSLEKIPFTFINAKDIVTSPDTPPLLGLADLSVTIYRGEADYRQALFMQGQDTLVVIGSGDDEANFRTGANASILLPIGGDAKFIGVESTGLTEMREALENDKNHAAMRGGQLMDSVSRERESGDALKIRVAARTATLNQIALAGAFGLQTILRFAAEWVGIDPEKVKVIPNLDFVDDTLGGEELVKLATAKQLGVPLSNRSIHLLMQNKGLTELDLEEELAEIEAEEPLSDGSTNSDGPVKDEGEEDE